MRLTILQKLALFITVISLIMFMFGVFNFFLFRHYDNYVLLSSDINKLQSNAEKLKDAEKNFYLWDTIDPVFYQTGQSKSLVAFDTCASEIVQTLESFRANGIIQEGGFDARINEVETLLSAYVDNFKTLVSLKQRFGFKDYGVVGRMRDLIHQVEENSTSDAMMVKVLTLRRHEKDYLLRGSASYVQKFNSVATLFASELNQKGDFINAGLIVDYQSVFNEVAELGEQLGQGKEQGILVDLANSSTSAMQEIDLLSHDVLNLINKDWKSYAFIIFGAILAGILLALLLAYIFSRSLKVSFDRAFDAIKSVTDGDLNVEIKNAGNDEVGSLLIQLNHMVGKLKEIVSVVIESSESISNASSQMSKSSQLMSEGATDQASSAEEVSSSMEEMAANIQENTANAKETEQISTKGANNIKESNELVDRTHESMRTITNKISIIGEIARQTNLLALNAAVEAARAGEHGKGFAVVAAEIRRLAERSQVAAKEIDEESLLGVEIAQESSSLLSNTVPEIMKTSELISMISNASIEQNNGAEQINNAIQNLNNIVQQNAAVAEEMAANSEELNHQAERLNSAISFFSVSGVGSEGLNRGAEGGEKMSGSGVGKGVSDDGIVIDLGDDDDLDSEFEKF